MSNGKRGNGLLNDITNPPYVFAIDKATHGTSRVLTMPAASVYGELVVDETYLYRNGSGSGGVAKFIKCETDGTIDTISALALIRRVPK